MTEPKKQRTRRRDEPPPEVIEDVAPAEGLDLEAEREAVWADLVLDLIRSEDAPAEREPA